MNHDDGIHTGPADVTHVVWATEIGKAGSPRRIVAFKFWKSDPYAVTIELPPCLRGDDLDVPQRWSWMRVDLDRSTQGKVVRFDRGLISSTPGRMYHVPTVELVLWSADGPVSLSAPALVVLKFLAETYQLVGPGKESDPDAAEVELRSWMSDGAR